MQLRDYLKYIQSNQILVAVLVIAGAWLVWELRTVLAILFVAFIIMAAVLPAINFFERKNVPHWLACLLPYLGIVIVMAVVIIPMFPLIGDQAVRLVEKLPTYIQRLDQLADIHVAGQDLQSFLASRAGELGRGALSFTGQFFELIAIVVTSFMTSIYLSLDRRRTLEFIASLFPRAARQEVSHKIGVVEDVLGRWVRGQLITSFLVGLMVLVALLIWGIDFALPLAVFAAFAELIPYLGPLISAIPAVLIAIAISPIAAIGMVITYIVIQQIENYILSPNIMSMAVGLPPLAVIIIMLIGAKFAGIAGILLAIPFAVTIQVLLAPSKPLEEAHG